MPSCWVGVKVVCVSFETTHPYHNAPPSFAHHPSFFSPATQHVVDGGGKRGQWEARPQPTMPLLRVLKCASAQQALQKPPRPRKDGHRDLQETVDGWRSREGKRRMMEVAQSTFFLPAGRFCVPGSSGE